MRRLAVLVLVLAAAGAVAAPAPAGATAPGLNVVGLAPAEGARTAADAGARWVRLFARWDAIEPLGPGRWDPGQVAILEDGVNVARARGLRVVVVVLGAPSWASGSGDHLVPPRDPGDYGRFLGALAARFQGRVTAWEVWNEPDEAEFWHGQPGPQAYAPLLAAAHRGVKAADPGALVLAAPSTGNNYGFLEGLYAAGAGPHFDGVAVHTDTACSIADPRTYYRENGRVGRFSFLGFREVHAVLAAHGHAERPIIMTELGWSAITSPCQRGAYAGQKPAGVSEAQQATFLRRAYHCLRDYPYVTAALWFSVRDAGPDAIETNRYGLLRFDMSPRPAFSAFTESARGDYGVSGDCGDFTAPDVRVLAPAAGAAYDRSLTIRASARDSSRLGRISLYANGRRIRSFTEGLENDRAVGLEWMGARNLPYGPVTVTIEALDEFGNTTRRDIGVTRTNPASLPSMTTTVRLRLSGKRLRRTVRGSVRVRNAARARRGAFPVTGKVQIRWQYRRKTRSGKTRWVTLHKRSRNANKAFRYTQRLRRPGRWRVLARYRGDPPFRPATSRRLAFRAR